MAKIVLGLGAPHSPNLPSTVAKNPAYVEAGLYADLRRAPCRAGHGADKSCK